MDKPILFNAEMVRAILDGRKTQTRRVVKPQPWYEKNYWFYEYKKGCSHYIGDVFPTEHWALENMLPYCPYGQVGDRLWVKEDIFIHCSFAGKTQISYQATNDSYRMFDFEIEHKRSFRAALFMSKKFARIFLEVTDIRVERVQDISNEDIRAEGAAEFGCTTHRLNFQTLWDSINKKRGFGWDVNPWVWCIEFKKV